MSNLYVVTDATPSLLVFDDNLDPVSLPPGFTTDAMASNPDSRALLDIAPLVTEVRALRAENANLNQKVDALMRLRHWIASDEKQQREKQTGAIKQAGRKTAEMI